MAGAPLTQPVARRSTHGPCRRCARTDNGDVAWRPHHVTQQRLAPTLVYVTAAVLVKTVTSVTGAPLTQQMLAPLRVTVCMFFALVESNDFSNQ